MSVAQNLNEIRATIEAACRRSGRDARQVKLLAVSKLQPLELIEEAYALGVRDFGENYVQQLVEKKSKLAHLEGIRWHLIGSLQSNKAKLAVANADFFHALDSSKLVSECARRAVAIGVRQPWPVFIQVNIDAEPTKSGVTPDEVAALAKQIRTENALKLLGLMCVPKAQENPELSRSAFQRMARLAKSVDPLLELSMGMSDDFEVAIEEGAHWIRVGKKLFGERA